MEWTYAERRPGQSLQEFFAQHIDHEDEEKSFTLLALSHVMRGVCYGAYRYVNKRTGIDRVSALVIPVRVERRSPRIGYRIYTEYEAPLEHHRCPRSIYAMLTRFRHCEEYAHAKAWRARVEDWYRSSNALPLRTGMRIVFKRPVRFDNGEQRSEFIVAGLNPLLLRGDDGRAYAIPDLRERIGRGDAQVTA